MREQTDGREVLLRIGMVLASWYIGAVIGQVLGDAVSGGVVVNRTLFSPSLLLGEFLLSAPTPWAQLAFLPTAVVGVLFPLTRWPRWVCVVVLVCSALTIYLMRIMWQNF
jgi:hypothetical protein